MRTKKQILAISAAAKATIPKPRTPANNSVSAPQNAHRSISEILTKGLVLAGGTAFHGLALLGPQGGTRAPVSQALASFQSRITPKFQLVS
jgi:hypothetical protein